MARGPRVASLIDALIALHLSARVPARKLVLGVALYGRRGLGGVMFWELSQDAQGALLGAVHRGLAEGKP